MAIEFTKKKFLVTGEIDVLGTHVVKPLVSRGELEKNILMSRLCEHDLRGQEVCGVAGKGRGVVIHLAATVGIIGYNLEKQGGFFYDNLMIA